MPRPVATAPPTPLVPARYLRQESAYRSLGPSRARSIGCGLLLKTDRILDFDDIAPGDYSAVWCLRGSGTYRDESGASWRLEPGTLFHRFPGRRHTTVFDPGCRWAEAFLMFAPSVGNALAGLGVIDPRRAVQRPGIDLALLDDLARQIGELRDAEEGELPRHLARLLQLLTELVSRDGERQQVDPHRAAVDLACRRLADEQRLPLPALARALGLSYERFRKVFRERMGMSPGEYRIRRRIDRARALLTSGAEPVKAIADTLGYPNPYAFSAQFKQVVGESPEAFRRRH